MQNRPDLLQTVLDRLPVGVLLFHRNRVILNNPASQSWLGAPDQIPRVDGPDGPLIERLGEVRAGGTFDYRVPASQDRLERVLRVQVVPLDDDRLLVRLDDMTALQDEQSRRDAAIGHAFHELKTPFAVLSMGLSHLETYYDRLSDEERRETIQDIAEQARELTVILETLFRDLRHGAD